MLGNLTSLIGAGAEFIGGGMWALGRGFASIITAPISGGASLALEPAAAAVTVTAGIWTHAGSVVVNAFTNRPSGKTFSEQEAREAGKNYKMSDEYFEDHIVGNHGSKSTKTGKSKFSEGFDIKKGIKENLTDKKATVTANTDSRAGYIFTKEYGYPIGTNKYGQPVTKLKVVIGENGVVITAFPIK